MLFDGAISIYLAASLRLKYVLWYLLIKMNILRTYWQQNEGANHFNKPQIPRNLRPHQQLLYHMLGDAWHRVIQDISLRRKTTAEGTRESTMCEIGKWNGRNGAVSPIHLALN